MNMKISKLKETFKNEFSAELNILLALPENAGKYSDNDEVDTPLILQIVHKFLFNDDEKFQVLNNFILTLSKRGIEFSPMDIIHLADDALPKAYDVAEFKNDFMAFEKTIDDFIKNMDEWLAITPLDPDHKDIVRTAILKNIKNRNKILSIAKPLVDHKIFTPEKFIAITKLGERIGFDQIEWLLENLSDADILDEKNFDILLRFLQHPKINDFRNLFQGIHNIFYYRHGIFRECNPQEPNSMSVKKRNQIFFNLVLDNNKFSPEVALRAANLLVGPRGLSNVSFFREYDENHPNANETSEYNFGIFKEIMENAEYAEDIIWAFTILEKNSSFTLENRSAVCQNAKYFLRASSILNWLENVNGSNEEVPITAERQPTIKVSLTSEIIAELASRVCLHPQDAENIVPAICILGSNPLVSTPENRSLVYQNASNAVAIAMAMKIFHKAGIVIKDNEPAIIKNAEYLNFINAAFEALHNAGKLTQTLVDEIFLNPKDAMEIAKANGGKPAGNKVARDFCQINTASTALLQAWRQGSDPNNIIGKLPAEMLTEISAKTVNSSASADTEINRHVAIALFDNKSTFFQATHPTSVKDDETSEKESSIDCTK